MQSSCSAYPQSRDSQFLLFMVGSAIILNLLDAVLTLVGVYTGKVIEANPLMDNLLQVSPVLFALAKMSLVSLGLLLLWRLRDYTSAAFGILLSVAIYSTILVHHVRGLILTSTV